MIMTAIPSAAAFHRHLDACRQCRENPFRLCLVGHALLTGSANEAPPKMEINPDFIEPQSESVRRWLDGVK